MVSEPGQQERSSIPADQQFWIAIFFLLPSAGIKVRLKPSHIRSGDTDTIQANRKYLGNCDFPELPCASVVSTPESSVAIHSGKASTAKNEVAFVLAGGK